MAVAAATAAAAVSAMAAAAAVAEHDRGGGNSGGHGDGRGNARRLPVLARSKALETGPEEERLGRARQTENLRSGNSNGK